MPSSGRWVVLFTGRVSPPRRRVPFCTGRKEPKSRQRVGTIGRNGFAAPASMLPTPWTPVYGGYPLGQAEHFRRAKSEWLSAILSGPLGPGFAKITATAVPQLRLALPSKCSRSVFRRRGDPCGRPEHGPASVRPLRKEGWASVFAVGAAHLGRPPFYEVHLAGAPRGSPTQPRKAFLKPVGEGTTPLIKGPIPPIRGKWP